MEGKFNWNFSANTENFFYSIVAPKTIQGNTDYTISLTIHDGDIKEPVVFRISIEDEDNGENGLKIFRDVTLTANTTEFVTIPIGDLSLDSKYKLTVKGISGIALEKICSLESQTRSNLILIQTDKAIYKPNDCIKFRIIVLDEELKATQIEKKELNISINDPFRNLIRKWNGVNTKNGVFSDEFQLSDLPMLGEWIITVAIGNQKKTATVEVAEYVLPKFEVFIESADDFAVDDEKVKAIIRTNYTDGQPGKATIIVTIEEEGTLNMSPFSNQNNVTIQKSFEVNGQKTIELDIVNDLKYCRNDNRNYTIKVEATETLTGSKQSTEKKITIHYNCFVITTNLKGRTLKQDTTVTAKISVRKYDDSLPDISKKLTLTRNQFYGFGGKSVTTADFELDENGDTEIELYIDKNETSFSLEAFYSNKKNDLGRFYPSLAIAVRTLHDKPNLKAKVLTENCSINKEIEIEVKSYYPFKSYTYIIVARGRILETKTISCSYEDSESSEYIKNFSFFATSEHTPKTNVLIFNVHNKELVSSNVTVRMNSDFKNFIELDVIKDANPSQIIDINVKTNQNSYIGLLGIDKSSKLLRSGNDLTIEDVWNEFGDMFQLKNEGFFRKNQPFYKNCWKSFQNIDLVIFSNTVDPIQPYMMPFGFGSGMPSLGLPQQPMAQQAIFGASTVSLASSFGSSQCFGSAPLPQLIVKPKIRKVFPETWIWDLIEDKGSSGLLNLKKKVPDSLTTWVLTGFSIDPINGLAITKAPSELRVQQKFHVSLNLPYSVKRGEVVTVTCSIFNYLPNEIEAEVVFENEHNDFEFVDSAVDDKIYPEISKERSRKKKLLIHPDDALNAYFEIRPIKVGSISLKVLALSTVASDCVIKELNVECEGVPQYVNKAVFLDLREKCQIEPIDVLIEIPKIAVPDSTRIEITCLGDLLGGTIKNLEKLIRLPFGCGEQNMLNFVPNIVILDYLKHTCQLNDQIESKLKKFMTVGYLNELKYKHKDGSFSAFGEYDNSGSTWLTAFVAKSFRQAADHIVIQDQIIDEALKWLSRTQADDGSFVEKGSICHKEMQSGSSNGVALTAYVLTTFLMEPNAGNAYANTIQKAIKNIIESIKDCTDVYSLAVCAYALQWTNNEVKQDVLNRLKVLAKTNENYVWWEKTIESKGYFGGRQSKTLNVEITGYALMAFMLNKNESECLPVFRWILNQRNDLGGFEGTQDTIIGINALANFAAKIAAKNNDVNIDIASSNDTNFNFKVNQDNALVLQSQKLSSDVKSVPVNATGSGFALLQVGYRYNIDVPETESAFTLKPLYMRLNDECMCLEICTSYKPLDSTDSAKQSNMVVVEASLPSGWIVNTELLDTLKTNIPILKRTETKCGNTVAVLYLDHLTSDPVILTVDGLKDHDVDEQKPSSIVIYDYYDSALSARQFYSEEPSMETDG